MRSSRWSKVLRLWGMLVLTQVGVLATAQSLERISAVEEQLYGERVFVQADFATMRNVRAYWQTESQKHRYMRGCEFALCGNGDAVLRVTIPVRLLFAANDTVLSPSADAQLRPFLHLLRGDAPLTSVVVACHSDNNGSKAYLETMTLARARSVERWLRRQGIRSAKAFPYGLADQCPRDENNTLSSRERNRRLTLYFVPAKEMLKQAKKNKLQNSSK